MAGAAGAFSSVSVFLPGSLSFDWLGKPIVSTCRGEAPQASRTAKPSKSALSSTNRARCPSARIVIPAGAKRNGGIHRKARCLRTDSVATPLRGLSGRRFTGDEMWAAEMERERRSLPQDRPLSAGMPPALAPALECRVPPGPFRKGRRRTAAWYMAPAVAAVMPGLSRCYLGEGARKIGPRCETNNHMAMA